VGGGSDADPLTPDEWCGGRAYPGCGARARQLGVAGNRTSGQASALSRSPCWTAGRRDRSPPALIPRFTALAGGRLGLSKQDQGRGGHRQNLYRPGRAAPV